MHIEGCYKAPAGKIAIVAARFNEAIVEKLIQGAEDALIRHQVAETNIDLVRVPGAYELPVVVKNLTATNRYSGVIALGVVIRGATAHFDYVAGPCASGLQQIAVDTGVPVSFGVLTTETIEQAWERAGTKSGNKGFDAAISLLETIQVVEQIHEYR